MKKCLNLACGNMPIKSTNEEHWINSDKYYYPGTAEMHPDWGVPSDYDWEQGDFTTDLAKYEDNSIDKVRIIHGLEHTYLEGAVHTLEEIYRILKPSGTIEIEVPDLVSAFNFNTSTMIDMVYGGRNENSLQFGHNCGFTRDILLKLVNDCGFTVEEMVTSTPDKSFKLKGAK